MSSTGVDRPLVLHLTAHDISLALLLLAQLEAMSAAGYDVVGASAPGPFVERLRARGIEHVALQNGSRRVDPLADVRAAFELYRLLRRRRPAVVHTHTPKPGVYGRIVARLARVPVVVNTQHGLYAQPTDRWPRRFVVYAAERLAAACSDAELVQNGEDLEVLRRLRVPATKLQLVGNGIDLTRFRRDDDIAASAAALRAELGAGEHDVVCGAVGRLVGEKGYRDLFAAVRLLRARGVPVVVVVAGPDDGSKADAITAEERRAAADDGVVFLGMRDDVEVVYAALDLFVLASHREGFPRAAMEAAAMGLPVITTDVRGCREVVEHGVNGVLVPPSDPAALAGAIEDLVGDAPRRATLGAASARKAREQFDEQTVIDRTLATYSALLTGGRR